MKGNNALEEGLTAKTWAKCGLRPVFTIVKVRVVFMFLKGYHSFIHYIFIKHLLCARYCCRYWAYSSEKERYRHSMPEDDQVLYRKQNAKKGKIHIKTSQLLLHSGDVVICLFLKQMRNFLFLRTHFTSSDSQIQ